MKQYFALCVLFIISLMLAVIIMGLEPMIVLGQKIVGVERNEQTIGLTHEAVQSVTSFTTYQWSDLAQQQFTANERKHLEDVGAVFGALRLLTIFAVALLLVLFAIKQTRRKLLPILHTARQSLLKFTIALVILIALAGVFFHPVFDWIHLILFPQGNWTFPAGSKLLEIVPEPFWIAWGVSTWILAVGIVWLVECLTCPAQPERMILQ